MEQFPPIAAWSAILAYMSQTAQKATNHDERFTAEKGYDSGAGQVRRLEHIFKRSLLDSGILCCLVHILNALLDPDEANQKQKATDRDELFTTEKDYDGDEGQVSRFEVQGIVVHIMKVLANHPLAAQSLIEDDSLQLLVQMVANGSLIVFS